ncbi:SGNH/GDSL hydrolase family protein [Cellulophaga sp. F20128]|uniref:SGNH/GDSL hydrolase family protein n=1 Tax=Cellulophaga sp. F20128 TaxID=2926413 RepID=UPI001FF5E14F|nr:SGNH/GDSL hydrolase family protein [Cellulophaga sp. F20128]MCK0155789.1 SGNH/GDSL hydrolase family protein [Cellulophaga sp. F20128]
MKNTILALSLLVLTAFSSAEKPKILIIGDSISLGYTPFVTETLKEVAIVTHNPGNAQHTGTGLERLEKWLSNTDYDIIQFNWGLWDLCYRHADSKVYGNRDKINGKVTYTIEEYTKNLESLVAILKEKSNAKLIFVSTSYVPEGEAGRYVKDPQRYNKVAKKVMKKHGILVNDIYKTSKKIHQTEAQAPGDVHYTKAGYKELARSITKVLHKEL